MLRVVKKFKHEQTTSANVYLCSSPQRLACRDNFVNEIFWLPLHKIGRENKRSPGT